MPAAAWAIAHALGMGTELTTGMVLVGSVASGTSSTLMVYIAGGDVALSVTVAVASTLVGLVATPLLVRFYVDAAVPVDVAGLLASLVEIVAAPVAVGLALNRLAPRLVGRFERALPIVSMAAILLIIGAVVAGSRASIAAVGPLVLLAVALHNGAGLVCGYWSGRLLGFDESTCRTLALEVGMQNSGLAAALGKLYFSPLAALPGRSSPYGTTYRAQSCRPLVGPEPGRRRARDRAAIGQPRRRPPRPQPCRRGWPCAALIRYTSRLARR